MSVNFKFKFGRFAKGILYPEVYDILKNFRFDPFILAMYTSNRLNVTLKHEGAWRNYLNHNLHSSFPYSAPVSGSTEAIYKIFSSEKLNFSSIILEEGAYEGFRANSRYFKFDRKIIPKKSDWDKFFIENKKSFCILAIPDFLTGNHFDTYCSEILDGLEYYNIPVWIDLSFYGMSINDIQLKLTHKNIRGIFSSVSKPFGLYHLRDGIIFLRNENDFFKENKEWFHNNLSMSISTELLSNFDSQYLPKKYKKYQLDLCQKYSLSPSDTITLAMTDDIQYSCPQSKISRVCLADEMTFNIYAAQGLDSSFIKNELQVDQDFWQGWTKNGNAPL